MSSDEFSDEYVTSAKNILRGLNSKDLANLLVSESRYIVNSFTNDFMLLPPEKEYPDCICIFEATDDPRFFLNDKRRNQRTGKKLVLRNEAKTSIEMFKEVTGSVRSKKSKKFITSAGVPTVSGALHNAHILYGGFLDTAMNNVQNDKSPEELFLGVIAERNLFEQLLVKTPSTPDKIKKIARERIKARARLFGDFRMSKPLFNQGCLAMYVLVDEFEGVLAGDLIERGLDNNLVYQYYVGI